MIDTDLAGVRLKIVAAQAEALQSGLHQRQDDLLMLEESVRHLSAGRSNGLTVADQAEDLRRAVSIHSTEQLAEIRTTLTRAGIAIVEGTADGTLTPENSRALAHMLSVTGEEASRAAAELNGIDKALAPTAHAAPAESHLAEIAQYGVDKAARRLEQARRSVFRIVEDLPVITRAMEDIPVEHKTRDTGIDVMVQPTQTEQRHVGLDAEQRHQPSMTGSPNVNPSPGPYL